ncbi:nucleotide exchange factor GrpE [Dactylosporangium salmoneum]|uniref:Protein GrpE n=1 Tax=Dactylosporangium salmoneum TaxID=53361 RepID=A0ABN3GDR2_9ACTN
MAAEETAEVDWEERWRRAAAEADNARKRCERLIAERTAAERTLVAAAWLPILDHLDLALHHADADPAAIVQGVTQVRDEARAVLTRLGFQPVGAEGEPFDPARHEAAEAVEAPDAPPGSVVRVVRPGYGGPAGLLRPAVVAVARPPAEKGADDGG